MASSSCVVLRNVPRGSGLRFSACIVALLVAALLRPAASAQRTPDSQPEPDSAQPHTADPSAEKDASKKGKYNVARIGQRGVGHGFNLYSLRREHELGEHL